MDIHERLDKLRRRELRIYRAQEFLGKMTQRYTLVVAATIAAMYWQWFEWLTWEIATYIVSGQAAITLMLVIVMHLKIHCVMAMKSLGAASKPWEQ